MADLSYRQKKIQEKRKNTPFREFLRDIASWWPVNFYKYNNVISVFPEGDRVGNVAGLKDYHKQYENVMEDVQESGNFFATFQQLFTHHYKPALVHFAANDNGEYCHCGFGSKNAYLSFVAGFNAENVAYSTQVWNNVTNIFNSSLVFNNSSNIYQSRSILNSYNIFYSQYIYNANNLWFCSNCFGCQNCIECNDLENKSYCIGNVQYSPEDYNEKKAHYIQNDYYLKSQQVFGKESKNYLSENSSGQGLYRCTNIQNGFNASNFTNGNNVVFSDGIDNSSYFYDCMDTGTHSNHFYGICYGGEYGEHCYIGCYISQCNNVYYSYFMESCSFCFGCIGLKNKHFCIFNKQYDKEERHHKIDEIFSQMEADGTLGDFFPGSMNPFYFNDTAAYLIDPSFTKEEVAKLGYFRRDEPIKVDIPTQATVVKTDELSSYESFDDNNHWMINPEILNKIIVDEEGNYYRIVKMEYDFLMKYSLPLPRKHRLTRMKDNFVIKK